MKTYATKASDIQREWYVVDADGKTLGRLAGELVRILRGKHKPIFTPHLDCGDHVIVINAAKLQVTGRKLDAKLYYRHSMYPGGLKAVVLRDMMARNPSRVLQLAVRRMLPKGPLGRAMIKKLRIYPAASHPHQAQQPKPLEL